MSETSKQPVDSPFDKISQLIADPEAIPASLGDFDRLRDGYFDALLSVNRHPKQTRKRYAELPAEDPKKEEMIQLLSGPSGWSRHYLTRPGLPGNIGLRIGVMHEGGLEHSDEPHNELEGRPHAFLRIKEASLNGAEQSTTNLGNQGRIWDIYIFRDGDSINALVDRWKDPKLQGQMTLQPKSVRPASQALIDWMHDFIGEPADLTRSITIDPRPKGVVRRIGERALGFFR
jgi:hypothetical protein